MFQRARWISCEKYETPIILRRFTLEDFTCAELDITGLGYFEAYINGQKITEDLFLPAQTDYHYRDTTRFHYPIVDQTHYRIHYLTLPVTHLLKKGENTLEILLGNGWYRQTRRAAEGDMCYDTALKALYEIHVETAAGKASVYSDGTELYGESNILESNLYYGETIDMRRETRYTEQVKLTEIENTRLVPQTCPGDRLIRKITPKLILREGDVCIYDNGENITGCVSVETDCPSGEEVSLTFSENLNKDHTDLDLRSTGCNGSDGQLQQDRFINNGGKNIFTPKFVFHGFRYFKIKGSFTAVKTHVVHTDVPDISEFECDNPTLNWLFGAFKRTLMDNLHGSVPSDCPHRERLGYTGDGQLTAEAAMYCFDLSEAYRKWIRDIFDGQGENGHIQHTAPLQGGGGGPAGWGGAALVLPYQYYRFYGDKAFLVENYPKIQLWVSYMRSRTEKGLIVREEEGGWCLGDWGTATSISIDPAFVNSACFVYQLGLLKEIAAEIDRQEDIGKLEAYISEYETAILERFFDPETGDFCGNAQFANVFGLSIGLGDQRSFAHILEAIDQSGDILDIGMIAMDLLIELLFQRDEQDRALRAMELLLGRMIATGATTVWEYPYRIERSNCHHMFCGMVRTLFSEMLGIKLGLDGRVELAAPKLPAGIHYVRAATTLHGERILVEHTRTNG